MKQLSILPIVEGVGEDKSIRQLLQRIWQELLGEEYVDVRKAIRKHRTQLVLRDHLTATVDLAARKLKNRPAYGDSLILLLLDSDGDPPCELGPKLLGWMRDETEFPVACVLAHHEFETWFVAAAESLTQYLDLAQGDTPVDNPEADRAKKRWIRRRFRGVKYNESIHQPRLTQAMDLGLARARCSSFDKLCRELEACRDLAEN